MLLDCILQSFERRLLGRFGGAGIGNVEDMLGKLEVRMFGIKRIPHNCQFCFYESILISEDSKITKSVYEITVY